MIKKIKIMLSRPMKGKTIKEIEEEEKEMVNIIFDYYGENNCCVISSIVENHEEKSALECFSESIFFMSQADILCMGFDWEKARGCKLEHEIAKAYDVSVVYIKDLQKEIK